MEHRQVRCCDWEDRRGAPDGPGVRSEQRSNVAKNKELIRRRESGANLEFRSGVSQSTRSSSLRKLKKYLLVTTQAVILGDRTATKKKEEEVNQC
jgi:hypothetical protein